MCVAPKTPKIWSSGHSGLPKTHSTGADESWHKADEGCEVSVDEADGHQDSREDNVGVGMRNRHLVNHMCGGLGLVADHHHVLEGRWEGGRGGMGEGRGGEGGGGGREGGGRGRGEGGEGRGERRGKERYDTHCYTTCAQVAATTDAQSVNRCSVLWNHTHAHLLHWHGCQNTESFNYSQSNFTLAVGHHLMDRRLAGG